MTNENDARIHAARAYGLQRRTWAEALGAIKAVGGTMTRAQWSECIVVYKIARTTKTGR